MSRIAGSSEIWARECGKPKGRKGEGAKERRKALGCSGTSQDWGERERNEEGESQGLAVHC